MPTPVQFPVLDLGGGQNDGLMASEIADNEMAYIRNLYTFGKELVTRNGITKVTTTPYSERLVSLFGGKMDDIWRLFVGTSTGLARKDGSGLTRIIPSDTAGYAASTEQWRMRLYKNILYAVRRDTGRLKRSKSDFMQDAGIAAPGTAPTLADGGAGSLLAGSYFGVVTYYNRDTDAESNPSVVSSVLALGASKKIAWSNIPVSSNGQVNARRLYRTLLNQQGEYYFVDQINDNFTTAYASDDFLTASLGRQVSFRNGLPPSGIEHIEVWKERDFLANATSVFFSEPFLPESFYSSSQIDIYPDDGHSITGLLAYGDRLVVAKSNAVHYLVGTDPSDFQVLTLSDKHGCAAPDSLKTAEGYLFWYEGNNIYRSDGSAVTSITDIKIRALLDRVPDAYKKYAVGAVRPKYSQYRLSVPLDGATTPTVTLVYNYRNGSWQVYDSPYGGPSAMGDFYDTNEAHLIYGVFDDNNCVYDLDLGNTDDGVAINSVFDTKAYGFQTEGSLKGLHRVQILTDAETGVISLGLIRDMGDSAYVTRAGMALSGSGPWKRYNLSNLGNLAKNVQLRVSYSGTPRIKVGGLIFEAVAFKRSDQPL